MLAEVHRELTGGRAVARRPCPETGPGLIISGNAFADGARNRGWLVGHFVRGSDARLTGDVEVKVSAHRQGDARTKPVVNRTASTLVVLIRGRVRLRFPRREVVLRHEGDYALWPAGVPHTWVAEAASRVISVRWPSRPRDQVTARGWAAGEAPWLYRQRKGVA